MKAEIHKSYKNLNWQRIDSYLFYTFLLIYATYLFFLCYKLNIWEDEAYSLSTSANSLSKVINLSYYFEGQPPGYFIILSLWRKINDGIFFARLLSVLFILLSAFVLNKLLKLIFEKVYTKWVIVLFLLNPFTVWASHEIRLYSLLIFLSLLAIYLFYQIYFYNTKIHKFFFILVCTIGVYTQYYFLFLVISLSLIVLVSKGWRLFFNFCLWTFPIALLFLPNLLYIKEQLAMHQYLLEGFSFADRIRSILITPQEFLIAIKELPNSRIVWWSSKIILGLLLIISLFKLYKADTKQISKDFRGSIEIYIPIIFLFVVFLIVLYFSGSLVYSDKYMTIAFPFYCLLYSAFNVYSGTLKKIIYGIFVTYFIVVLLINYKSPYMQDFDYKSVAKFVKKNEHPREPVLFYNKALAFTFKHYYQGDNLLNPLPDYISDHSYYECNVMDTINITQSLKKAGTISESFLLITVVDVNLSDSIKVTRNSSEFYLRNNYESSIDTIFNGKMDYSKLRIRRLKLKDHQ